MNFQISRYYRACSRQSFLLVGGEMTPFGSPPRLSGVLKFFFPAKWFHEFLVVLLGTNGAQIEVLRHKWRTNTSAGAQEKHKWKTCPHELAPGEYKHIWFHAATLFKWEGLPENVSSYPGLDKVPWWIAGRADNWPPDRNKSSRNFVFFQLVGNIDGNGNLDIWNSETIVRNGNLDIWNSGTLVI